MRKDKLPKIVRKLTDRSTEDVNEVHPQVAIELLIITVQELQARISKLEEHIELLYDTLNSTLRQESDEQSTSSFFSVQLGIKEKEKAIGIVLNVLNKGTLPIIVQNIKYIINNDKPIDITKTVTVNAGELGEIHTYNVSYQTVGMHTLRVDMEVNGKKETVTKQFTIK